MDPEICGGRLKPQDMGRYWGAEGVGAELDWDRVRVCDCDGGVQLKIENESKWKRMKCIRYIYGIYRSLYIFIYFVGVMIIR